MEVFLEFVDRKQREGIVLKETPYTGNPSDLRVLQRCVPNAPEILMRQC